jgi:peptidoglycan/xylan/chitin deacetylase (PgdA/CDA1 family)
LGTCVNRSAKEVENRGHWIDLHSYEHLSFPTLYPTDLKLSLERTQAAIYNACDLQPEQVRDVRPLMVFYTKDKR